MKHQQDSVRKQTYGKNFSVTLKKGKFAFFEITLAGTGTCLERKVRFPLLKPILKIYMKLQFDKREETVNLKPFLMQVNCCVFDNEKKKETRNKRRKKKQREEKRNIAIRLNNID